ncbi:hypothetical protein AQJ67_31700 [Streptomyces caeruleatus]|uniref:Secreted protein n=2 Tax=Streptomyces caeruleatus TaxID=661399 RepID=A0A101TS59_9ACTN|nr:hypothetical protein AQJ67_31700 [Streptomyces caeruleatus]
MRISGLLVVGAVAVAAAAFTSDGGGTADGRGGEGTIVTVGPSAGLREVPNGPPGGATPPLRQSPDGHVGRPAVTDPPPSPSRDGVAKETPRPSPSPSVSPKLLEAPGWLPPGPDSPDTDSAADPASVYDLLRDPAQCRDALNVIPRTTTDVVEWTLLRGLASACLAVQGEGGSWKQAVRDRAALADAADTCKGRAAYAVLDGLLDFHRRHPDATVRLKLAPSGTPAACGYRISGVDTGGDGEAKPGEVIGIELVDAYFDPAELLRGAVVSVGGQQVPGVPVLTSVVGGRLVLSAVVPALEPGPADVTVRHAGVETRMPTALVVTAPDTMQEPSTGSDPTAPRSSSHGRHSECSRSAHSRLTDPVRIPRRASESPNAIPI